MTRQCGDCQLCCRLLPVRELKKPANERCRYQRFRKGCAIYGRHPLSCALWNCRWLAEDDTADLGRPDRTHYVIDIMPEFITVEQDGIIADIEVVQIWVDLRFPDAHRDPDLRAYVERRAREGILALVRFDSKRSLTLIAPCLTSDGEWIEKEGTGTAEHSAEEIATKLQRIRA